MKNKGNKGLQTLCVSLQKSGMDTTEALSMKNAAGMGGKESLSLGNWQKVSSTTKMQSIHSLWPVLVPS